MTLGNPVFEADPSLDLAVMHGLTARTARYDGLSDPEAILCNGLVEEAFECVAELQSEDPPSRFDLEGELGDMLWYVSEISRNQHIEPAAVLGEQPLDAFQASERLVRTPIIGRSGQQLDTQAFPQATLGITTLRVVDVMRPANDALWIGSEERPGLAVALKDLVISVGWIATRHDLALSAAVRHTITKLEQRERLPHVIEKNNK